VCSSSGLSASLVPVGSLGSPIEKSTCSNSISAIHLPSPSLFILHHLRLQHTLYGIHTPSIPRYIIKFQLVHLHLSIQHCFPRRPKKFPKVVLASKSLNPFNHTHIHSHTNTNPFIQIHTHLHIYTLAHRQTLPSRSASSSLRLHQIPLPHLRQLSQFLGTGQRTGYVEHLGIIVA
jgi:hypothetical protein